MGSEGIFRISLKGECSKAQTVVSKGADITLYDTPMTVISTRLDHPLYRTTMTVHVADGHQEIYCCLVVLINKTAPVLECCVCWAKEKLTERIAPQKVITMYR